MSLRRWSASSSRWSPSCMPPAWTWSTLDTRTHTRCADTRSQFFVSLVRVCALTAVCLACAEDQPGVPGAKNASYSY